MRTTSIEYTEEPTLQQAEEILAIRPVNFTELPKLNSLFIQSVDDAFHYFTYDFKQQLLRQHNLPRLVKAFISPKASFFVLYNESNQEISGYCLLRQDKDIAYLYWMYVVPELRGSGQGYRLLEAALAEAQRRKVNALQLVTHDKEAFYRRAGFSSLRHVAGLLGGVDMVMMEYRF